VFWNLELIVIVGLVVWGMTRAVVEVEFPAQTE
jgi:hypothetical protein